VSPTVEFAGVVHAPLLYISKPAATQVAFGHLYLGSESSSVSPGSFCTADRLAETCYGIGITNAYPTRATIPFGYGLTGQVTVFQSVAINSDASKATFLL
jgi:hypothetical protein